MVMKYADGSTRIDRPCPSCGMSYLLEKDGELHCNMANCSYTEIAKPQTYICCETLEAALGDHRGLYSQTIGSIKTDELDSVVMYIGGDFKIKNPALVQYCPFCGKPRIRASQAAE